MRLRRLACVPLLIWACLTGRPSAAPPARVADLLDQYAGGHFDAAIAQLSERTDFDDLLKQLQRDGQTWIDARGPAEQSRRLLAAATFALEAARLDEWHEWKSLERADGQHLAVLSWKPAPLLIEWACARFRQQDKPQPIERWWQLGALAVAQRSEDAQFLVGDLNTGLGAASGEIGNTAAEIRHLDHAAERFPTETRFVLAQGVAREWSQDIAIRAKAMSTFTALKDNVDAGAEALMRSGALTLRDGHAEAAVSVLEDVDRVSRDPYVVYLARFFRGQAFEQLRRLSDAEGAYRGASATIPGAPSASLAFATLLFARDQRSAAQRMAASAIRTADAPPDPWREYAHADDRFWPQIIGRLRAEIRRDAGDTPIRMDAPTPGRPAPAAGTDQVTVDVSVQTGNTPLTSLTAADFVLLDNGVKQRVDSVERARIPLDVTLVLDLSGDPRGTRGDPPSPSAVAADINSTVQQVTQLLRADDRLRVLASDSSVTSLIPLQPVSSVKPIREVRSGGLSSLYDALVAALLQPVEPTRRHIVIATTKGRDTVSATSVQAVRFIAERSDVRLHLVMLPREADGDDARYRLQCTGITPEASLDVVPDTAMGLCWPTRRFWVPVDRRLMEILTGGAGVDSASVHRLLPAGQALADVSAQTGGALHQGGSLTEETPASVLRSDLETFKQSYSLRYTPQSVTRDGWHTVSVSVPGSAGATVRARRGYTMPAAAIAALPPPDPGAASSPARMYAELVNMYSRGDFESAATALRNWQNPGELIKRLDEGGNPWPATPRSEAVFALELAEAGLFARRADTFDASVALLQRFHRLIRHPLEPDAFERYWLWTELTILQGKIRPGTSETAVIYALSRFPDEPRFLLARAIVADQMFPFMGAMRSTAQTAAGKATDDHIERVTREYMTAMKAPETATEARVRLAWFLYRVGKHQDALARLDEIRDDPSNDRAMKYLQQLVRGHVQVALGQPAAGVEAYRRAIEQWPTAQSPYVGLMSTLIQTGARAEAEATAERILTIPSDQTDPWFVYWLGDYRLFPGALASLRGMIR